MVVRRLFWGSGSLSDPGMSGLSLDIVVEVLLRRHDAGLSNLRMSPKRPVQVPKYCGPNGMSSEDVRQCVKSPQIPTIVSIRRILIPISVMPNTGVGLLVFQDKLTPALSTLRIQKVELESRSSEKKLTLLLGVESPCS
jgi:hypothetical protein